MNNIDFELVQLRATQNETADSLIRLVAVHRFNGNDKAAFEIASKAAYTYRSGEAYSLIGEALLLGRGVARDLEAGIKALKRAVSLGDDVAKLILRKWQFVA